VDRLDLDSDKQTLLDFTSKLVRFRRAQPTLRRRKYFQGRNIRGGQDVAWLAPDGREMDDAAWQAGLVRTLGMLLSGTAILEVDERGEQITGDTVLALLNGNPDALAFTLPASEGHEHWHRVFDTSDPLGADRMYKAGGQYALQGRSVAVFKIVAPQRERRRVHRRRREGHAGAGDGRGLT
jgi:glycogen operon protein